VDVLKTVDTDGDGRIQYNGQPAERGVSSAHPSLAIALTSEFQRVPVLRAADRKGAVASVQEH
jgi:hypothetical protein